MKDQDIKEEKRAKNIIWASSEDYECEPLFLAFSPDGKADIYLNMIIGLSYKWYDGRKLEDFFRTIGGKNEELYEGLIWLGLENALYQKEKKQRSALKEIRREYAISNVKRYRKQLDHSLIERLRNAHCREILGHETTLKAEEEQILRAFSYSCEMTTEQIIDTTKQLFIKYFNYRPAMVKKEDGVYFLQKVAAAFHSIGKVSATYVRTKKYEDNESEGTGKDKTLEKSGNYLLQFSAKNNPENAKLYVTACFGKNIYSETKQSEIEKELCTGSHKNTHILFTRGETFKLSESVLSQMPRREVREIAAFRKECKIQHQKNKEHYEKNRSIYHNSIQRLAKKLRITLETENDTFADMSTHGRLCPQKVWQAVYLDNPRIFEKKEEVDTSGYSVDIMIDASSSRKNSQEFIAAQAYVLEKSLEMCKIPVQIYSYCSIRGYTVMRIFKSYDEIEKNRQVFRYVSAGNNRDGLAFRGAGYLMQDSKKQKRLLIVLTDASPEDDRDLGEGAFYKSKEYTGELAAKDAAKEVMALKRKGIDVIGVVTGSDRSVVTAREIFGRDFVKIGNINEFSEAVGRILNNIL